MDDPKLSEAIIKRLSEGNYRDDIIMDICEKNDMAWAEVLHPG